MNLLVFNLEDTKTEKPFRGGSGQRSNRRLEMGGRWGGANVLCLTGLLSRTKTDGDIHILGARSSFVGLVQKGKVLPFILERESVLISLIPLQASQVCIFKLEFWNYTCKRP